MSISHHHLTATLTPDGRVSPLAFFSLFLPLMAIDLVLYRVVSALPAPERGLTNESALMLLVIYMQYCLLSRRRHDADSTAVPAFLFLIVGAVCWYKTIDPAFFELDLPPSDRLAGIIEHVHHIGRILAAVMFLTALLKPGMHGPNRFGQEFGESSDRVSRWRTQTVMGAVENPVLPPQRADKVPKTTGETIVRRSRSALPPPDQRAGFGRLGRSQGAGHHGH